MADGRGDRIACPLPHLTSQMTGDDIRKRGPMRHWCPAAGSWASTSAQDAVCELLYVSSCIVGSRCHAFALRIRCESSRAHETTLMTYPHPPLCTITHYPYSDSLYLHHIITTSSHSISALPTLIPHSPPLRVPCIVYAIGTRIVCRYCLLACRVPGVELTQAIQTHLRNSRLGFMRDKNDRGGPTDKVGRSHEA